MAALLRAIVILCITFVYTQGAAAQQSVTGRVEVSAAGNGQYQASVYYRADNGSKTTGLGIRLHYNSSVIANASITDFYSQSLIANQILQDTNNFDNNPATDFFASAAWTDLSASWPADPVNDTLLFRLRFNLVNPGEPTQVQFTLTTSSLPAGYSASLTGASVILPPPNNPPQGADNTVSVNDAGSYSFQGSDFGFSDPNDTPPNTFKAVKITTLPESGSLLLDNTALAAGQFVDVTEISQLRYQEPASPIVSSDSFTFQVQDDGGGTDLDTTPRAMSIDLDIQRRTLIAFYNSTGGGNWSNKQDWLGGAGTECSWFGVECVDGKISSLNLNNNNLTGTIPDNLSRLVHLQTLTLNNNNLGGAIPAALGDLPALRTLRLHFNQLSGSIPPELGSIATLQALELYNNQLTGGIPPELGNLNNLIVLVLSFNPLSGGVPASLGNLSELQVLYLTGNQLGGSIPSELGSLTSLTRLSLAGNSFTGNIPSELGDLSKLINLYLHENQLNGPIPAELGQLALLEDLLLHDNHLTGVVPSVLGSLINLRRLALSFNQLTGWIPASLGNLTKLQLLGLRGNLFIGAVPETLGNLTELGSLYLSDNRLSWGFPQSIVNLQIPDLVISGNYFDSERNTLISLYNATNGDSWINRSGWLGPPGTECNWYGVICEEGLLVGIHMPGNGLVGSLPEVIGTTPHLTSVSLPNNFITGPWPVSTSGLNLNYNPIDTINPVQVVSTTHNTGMLITTSTNRLSFFYDVTDQSTNLTGLGLRVHFNSADISTVSFVNTLATSLVAFDVVSQADTQDFDNNPATDRYMSIAWAAVSGDWPGNLPIKLFDLDVVASSGLEAGDKVRIGFSQISSTRGYGTRFPLLWLTATPGSFDVDGDGQVQALTDALMIIRSSFGFTGQALVDRAIASGATNTTVEAITQRLLDIYPILDVDGNGTVDALTDALLIMRYAFGFRGTVLINNAVSGNATRTTIEELESYLSGFMN